MQCLSKGVDARQADSAELYVLINILLMNFDHFLGFCKDPHLVRNL